MDRLSYRAVAGKKWGKEVPILAKIIDIESENQHQKEGKQYIVIGTLYKDMHLRGSVSSTAFLHPAALPLLQLNWLYYRCWMILKRTTVFLERCNRCFKLLLR